MKESTGVYKPHFKDYIDFLKAEIKVAIKHIRYYRKMRFKKVNNKNVFYMVFEPFRGHPGLADRMKAIISTYSLSKSNCYDFKIFFKTPFDLAEYLTPKKNCCIDTLDELEYSVADTRLFHEVSWRKQIKLSPNKQYHCYQYSGNLMPRVFPHTGYKWCDLFHELFKPSEKLQKAYEQLNIAPKSYVCVHIRFVNALERFENTFFDNHLETQEERDALIARCKEGIKKVINEHKNTAVYVFSDSKLFLNSLNDLPVLTLDSSAVEHVSKAKSDSATLKTFIDLYVMSQSNAVYRFCAPEIYSISHYALLAATIGDIPFYDLNV